MDRRSKILAGGFGAVVAFLVLARVVYPAWILPLLTLDDRVREKSEELAKLEEVQAAVDKARLEYRDYVARNGSFDFGRVETAVRDRLNILIEKYKLENASTAPSRPNEDRKTGLTNSTITVTAVGTLEAAVNFMKEVAEMPELVRLGNPTLTPASSGRRGDSSDRVNLRLPIDLLVLPKNRTAGNIEPATLTKAVQFVRHSAQDYSRIWERTPFTEYVELQPLRVEVQRALTVEVGQPGILQATASGGDGNYKFDWNPKEGLTEPAIARTGVDTSAPRTQNYTVSVVDGVKNRDPVTATVVVTVREPKPKPEPAPTQPPPPPPPPVAATWPEGRNMTIVMTLLRNSGNSRVNELMVTNSRTRETTYHKVGDDFDGGKLAYVHQTGGLVRRDKKYFVYPLGSLLADCIPFEQAGDYPELKSAAERALALETAQAEAKQKAQPEENQPSEEMKHDSRGAQGLPSEATHETKADVAAPKPSADAVTVPNDKKEVESNADDGQGPQVANPVPVAAEPAQPGGAPSTQPVVQPNNRAQPQPGQTRPPGPNRPHRTKGNRPGRL